MSYDLFFRQRPNAKPFGTDDFKKYFGSRQHYEVQRAQAFYSNKDSGVYFFFYYTEPDERAALDDETDPSLHAVSFNLNYFRPHPFGLEAEPEVAAFVEQFNLTVSDPQTSGMGDGEYSREGFLRGWNAGNKFARNALLAQDPTQVPLTLPFARVEACWRWNFGREMRQNNLDFPGFVPMVMFVDAGGQVLTAVAWADGIPILLPQVDLVIVPRQELRPPSQSSDEKDIVVFKWAELMPAIGQFAQDSEILEPFRLDYCAPPLDLQRLIRAKENSLRKFRGVRFDQILDDNPAG